MSLPQPIAYAMRNRKFNMGPRITESSCFLVVRPLNNIRRGLALQIELDSMFDNYIQLD